MFKEPENGYFALALTCAVVLFAIAMVSWSVPYSKGYQRADQDHQSAYATHNASEEHERKCRAELTIEKALSCYRDSYNTDREQKRAEEDLDAQREMANWAEGMLWATIAIGGITAGVTALGVWYVAKTLKATSDTLDAANRTNDIMLSEQRPWLQFGASAGSPIAANEIEVFIWLDNRGGSPARNVEMTVLEGELIGNHVRRSGQSLGLSSVIFPNDPSPLTRHVLEVNGTGPWNVVCMAKYKLPNGDTGYTQTNFDVSRNGKIVEVREMPGGDTT